MSWNIAWLAVVVAAASAFVLGWLWYGPLFGTAWQAETGMTEEKMQTGNMPVIFGGSFVLNVIAAACLAALIGPRPTMMQAVSVSLVVGLGLVATAYGNTYLFAQKSTRLMAIDGGYMAMRILLMGVVIALLG